MDSDRFQPGHSQTRNAMRIVGPLLLAIGGICILIAAIDFFSAFGNFGRRPQYFWCFFLGLPFIALGTALTKFGFLGAVSRYVAGEVAPVGKDTVNYMARETRGAVKDIASAIGEGLRTGAPESMREIVRCHKCNEENESDSKFCKSCGASLEKTKTCTACGELNDPDARYCDHCGGSFAR